MRGTFVNFRSIAEGGLGLGGIHSERKVYVSMKVMNAMGGFDDEYPIFLYAHPFKSIVGTTARVTGSQNRAPYVTNLCFPKMHLPFFCIAHVAARSLGRWIADFSFRCKTQAIADIKC
jgi:hypothetical protein